MLLGLAWTGLWLDPLAPSFSVIQSLWIYYFEPQRGHRVPFSTEYRLVTLLFIHRRHLGLRVIRFIVSC